MSVTTPTTPATRTPGAGLVLAVACTAQFLVIVDETVVNVALPSINRDLHFAHPSMLAWVVGAYMVLFGGFLVLGGRGADLFGRRTVFVSGLLLFVGASLGAGLADTPTQLIVARAVQGLGAALMSPAALSLLVATMSDPVKRRQALGLWGGLSGIAGVSGVALGGMLTESASWRWVFWVNVPIGIVLAAVTLTQLPQDAGTRRSGTAGTTLDWFGGVLISGGLVLLLYTVINTEHRAWDDPLTVAGLGGAALLLVAFVIQERRAAEPLIRPGILRHRTVPVANAVMLLAAAGLYGMFFFMTLYLQLVLRWEPLRAGLAFTPVGVSIALFSGAAIQLMPRIGARALLVLGLAAAAGGQLLLLRTTTDGSYIGQILPALALCGCGFGLSLVPVINAAVNGLRRDEIGAGSGLINISQQAGGAIGVAVLATIATNQYEKHLADAAPPAAMLDGFHVAFTVSACLTLVAALLALTLPALRTGVDPEAMV